MYMIYDFVIVGGGAAGLSAAITFFNNASPSRRKKIIIIERMDRIGKKILATGNGRCNLSNANISPEKYSSSTPEILTNMLAKMQPGTTLDFFHKLGLLCRTDADGRIYPYCNQASVVLDVLRDYISMAEIPVLCSCNVSSLAATPYGFLISIENHEPITTRNILISTGGCAAPQLGSDGSGFGYARMLGHSINTIQPCLISIESYTIDKSLKGVRTHCNASLFKADGLIAQDTGEVQFIEHGLSGIPIFQLSRFFEQTNRAYEYTICLDFFPEISYELLLLDITSRLESGRNKPIIDCLAGMLNNRLMLFLLKQLCPLYQRNVKIEDISKKDLISIVDGLKRFRIIPIQTLAWDKAQATRGGVPLSEINPETCESLICPNLYFAGEILDVVGECGGYNLHWAWNTGILVGEAISRNSPL